MVGELQRYVDPAFVYDFDRGPVMVPDEEAARREGLNCVALAYLVVEGLYRCRLSPRQHCYETFSDTERFVTVPSLPDMQTGDLVWFGHTHSQPVDSFVPQYNANGYLLNWRESPVSHVAIYTGQQEDNDYLLLHATDIAGTNVIWPLQRFATYPRYEQIRRVSRLAICAENVPAIVVE